MTIRKPKPFPVAGISWPPGPGIGAVWVPFHSATLTRCWPFASISCSSPCTSGLGATVALAVSMIAARPLAGGWPESTLSLVASGA